MMTLDEAIKHTEEVAEEKSYDYQECIAVHDMEDAMACGKCSEEHKQLAEWLKELKQLREQKPCEKTVSVQDCINAIENTDCELSPQAWEEITNNIMSLPPATPKQDSILSEARAKIEEQEKWLAEAGCNAYNVSIAFESIKRALKK